MDSGAEVTVWLPVVSMSCTVESEESRRGVKYFEPGDNITPRLPNLDKRQHSLKVGHLLREASVDIVPVRNLLAAMCSLMEWGHDVYFTYDAGCYAIHTKKT